jgi:hypothetical protein
MLGFERRDIKITTRGTKDSAKRALPQHKGLYSENNTKIPQISPSFRFKSNPAKKLADRPDIDQPYIYIFTME